MKNKKAGWGTCERCPCRLSSLKPPWEADSLLLIIAHVECLPTLERTLFLGTPFMTGDLR